MTTDERIHSYCQNVNAIDHDNNGINLNDTQKLMQRPIMDNRYSNTHYHLQNQLNDKLKYNSINFSTSYWNNVFESMKMIIRYWAKIFNIGIGNSSVT
jgi:hypothetical protein